MLTKVYGSAVFGVEATTITVVIVTNMINVRKNFVTCNSINPHIMTIGIYSRQSTDKQQSIPFQMELGEKFANENGWKFKHYSDKGVSGGARIEDRKEFSQMLEDIQDGIIHKVWIWEQDRLEREPMTWYVFCDAITENGVELYEDGKIVDLNDENTFMLKGIKSLMNRSERKKSTKKSKEKLHSMVSNGYAHGLIPYGYTRDENKRMIIQPEEAEIISNIFSWSLDGLGYRAIANKLNDMEIPTSYNKMTNAKTTYIVDINKNNDLPEKLEVKNKSETKWVAGTIKNILYRETYIGIRKFGYQTISVPPIIDKYTFQQVHQQIEQRSKKSGSKTFHKYLLNDLVGCALCGKRYTGREVKKHFYYRCTSRIKKGESCGNSGIQMLILDRFIWERFFLSDVLLKAVQNSLEINSLKASIKKFEDLGEELKTKIKSIETKRKNAIRLVIDGVITDEDARADMARLDREKQDTELRLNKNSEHLKYLENSGENLKDIQQDLKHLKTNTSFNKKRELINKYIKKISIIFMDPWFSIGVGFNIKELPLEVYMMDKKYQFAIDTKNKLFIPLSENLQNTVIPESEWPEITEGMDKLMDTAYNRKFGART